MKSVFAGSVAWASDYCAEGCRFKRLPDQHSGSLNNWVESVAFVMTSDKWLDFVVFSDKDDKCRPCLTALVGC